MNELIELVKDLMADVKAKFKKKEILIIIDGLDRTSVQAAEKLFAEDGQIIALIDNVTMLLTVPISIIHSVKSPIVENAIGKMHVLKNIRLLNQDKKKDEKTEKNWKLMKDAVLRRLEPQLITDKALEIAVHYSGGVFRTLIELIVSAAVEADVLGSNSIGEKELEQFQLKKTFQEQVATDIRQVEADIFDIGERLLAARHTYAQTEIRAPNA